MLISVGSFKIQITKKQISNKNQIINSNNPKLYSPILLCFFDNLKLRFICFLTLEF